MSRKAAREYAYLLVFEYMTLKDINTPTKEEIFKDPSINMQDADYINLVQSNLNDHYEDIIETIKRNLKNFKLERVFKPDLAVLILAVLEMKYMEDIPLNVSINEAIELSKKFATDKSYQFVNGVLSGVFKELKQ